MTLSKIAAGIGSLALLLVGVPLHAQVALVSATPAAGSVVSKVSSVTLTFGGKLSTSLSGLEIVMTDMPGMAHGAAHQPMKMSGVKVLVGPDGKSLVATLARPLPAGAYDVNWRAAGEDTRRVTGKISFAVR